MAEIDFHAPFNRPFGLFFAKHQQACQRAVFYLKTDLVREFPFMFFGSLTQFAKHWGPLRFENVLNIQNEVFSHVDEE